MKIEIEIPDDVMPKLAKDIMDNYPEASSGNCLQCVRYDYKNGIFVFIDTETDTEYTVTTKDIARVLPKFIEGIIFKKWKFCGLTFDNVLQFDAGDYDGYSIDGVVQLAIFDDIIYG